ncbi:MAG: ABC transporter permease subunit, partial [Pseudooceanicola atlanticus]
GRARRGARRRHQTVRRLVRRRRLQRRRRRGRRRRGRRRRQALRRHALRNALIPVLTIIGLQFSFLLAGGIIIENVFYLPGLGRLIFQAISARDLIVVESVVMLLVFAVVIVNFAVEIAYALVDPRLRHRR